MTVEDLRFFNFLYAFSVCIPAPVPLYQLRILESTCPYKMFVNPNEKTDSDNVMIIFFILYAHFNF